MLQGKKYHHIDFLRFIFSLSIVYFHILHANIIPYVTDPLYEQLAKSTEYTGNIVVCFFIISGVFLYRSFCSDPDKGVFEYIAQRVVRLWPVLVFAIFSEALLLGKIDWMRTLINSMFLQCSGLSLEYKGILWYVSSFFFSNIYLYSILRCLPRRKAALVISIQTYFICVFVINYYGGRITGRETVGYFLNMGVLRGVAFTGAGILLTMIYEKLAHMQQLAPMSGQARLVLFVLKAAVEAGSILFLYRYLFHAIPMSNHIVFVLVFCLFLLCLISKNDPLGLLLNRKFFGFCGKYAYSIYVMQSTGFFILRKTLWLNQDFIANVPLTLSVSVLFSVILGFLVYYLVERPCSLLYKKWYRRYRTAAEAHPPAS